ncbi:helix-turn-helix domain-containing protein [Pseudomonas sp. NPDC089734]|uniref:helix-turn-helix domain-containing protein n=1 Tax=Pseudomonas sp. NPDC089734 TaxID=3364469 RepID=UPI003805FE87
MGGHGGGSCDAKMIAVCANDYENFGSLFQGVFVSFSSLSAGRLKAERARLGLNQASAAHICGVSREIWGRYERGTTVPGGDVLFSFANAGANVQFILTGSSGSEREAPAHLKELAQINIDRLERITEMLEAAAQRAGKRWPAKKLATIAAEVYNAISADKGMDEPQVERILKLVVNR